MASNSSNSTMNIALVAALILVFSLTIVVDCRYLPTRSDTSRVDSIKQLLKELLVEMSPELTWPRDATMIGTRNNGQQQSAARVHLLNGVNGGPTSQWQHHGGSVEKRAYETPHFLTDDISDSHL
ncbi:hypothetical protein GZH46_02023 [Fragariocoptes setiger]|uniref:Transmembrane protein n=1 Tax=Fragariocoptes setiger TaxID=1670756 RepID=A0ABQ7S7U5_9ACAR|nr:hypothetical protein GZH46_02023 [Fragariocoptes setiger]